MIRRFLAENCDILALIDRDGAQAQADEAARAIIADVRARGDAALMEYTRRFDWPELPEASALKVSQDEIDGAAARCGAEYFAVLERAAANIRAFHNKQARAGFMLEQNGAVIGQRVLPLDSAGIYVPGGTASYPSTVLMDAIPAGIAGVKRVVMVSPPDKNGRIFDGVLAAAKIAGISEIYKLGGAQAVAALAFGTNTIAPVDKICGPGNAYVAAAKRQVFGRVGIDMVAGPSEILIIADDSADEERVAADMLSQAEHDPLASAVLLTTCKRLYDEVPRALERRLEALPRRDVCRASIDNRSFIILCDDLGQAAELSNIAAPEHLELCVADPFALMGEIRHAGSIFLGHYAPEALGDYFAGPNHTLPTGGTARFSSPLSVDDYVKKSSFIYYDRAALEAVRDDIVTIAASEGLDAHAGSILVRFEDSGK